MNGDTTAEDRVTPPTLDTIRVLDGVMNDHDILTCAPGDWTPTSEMMKYARVYVSARPEATVSEMARAAETNREYVYRWRKSHFWRDWMSQLLLKAAGLTVGQAWKAVAEKACKGDIRASSMLMRRFDPCYRTAMQDSEDKRERNLPGTGAVAAAKQALVMRHAAEHVASDQESASELNPPGGGVSAPPINNMSQKSSAEEKPPRTKKGCPIDCRHYTVDVSEGACSECVGEEHPCYEVLAEAPEAEDA